MGTQSFPIHSNGVFEISKMAADALWQPIGRAERHFVWGEMANRHAVKIFPIQRTPRPIKTFL